MSLTAAVLAGCSDDDSPTTDPTSTPTGSAGHQGIKLSAEDLAQGGLDRLSEGLPEYAQPLFEEALKVDPYNVVALRNLAELAEAAGDTEKAADYSERLDEATRLQSSFKEAVRLEKTDLDQSIELYRQVLEVNEEWAEAHMRLGFALLHQGKTDEAEKELTRGLQLDPAMADIAAPSYD
jgi:tetratricopeptide (TPR) repeat protein